MFKVIGTDSSTGLPSGRFDKVICNESFHHFAKPGKMLQDFKRILKPGAKLYIRDSLKSKTRKQGHFHYSIIEMKKILDENGFALMEDHSTKSMGFLVLKVK